MEERVRRTSMDKSCLQLVVNLIHRVSAVPGLDNVIANLLRSVAEVIGGTNVIIYYWIDGELFLADLLGRQECIRQLDDPLARRVRESGEAAELEHDFGDTQMTTADFGKAYTWAFPLEVKPDLIGIVKMENLHIGMRDLCLHLPTFFNYAALVLKNEIRSQTRLQTAFDSLCMQMAARKQAERGLIETKAELEHKVAERTAALREVNRQLSHDIAARRQTEKTMGFLLECGLPATGEDFFLSLARYLAEQLQMEYVCIDRIEDDALSAETVAIYNDDAFDANVRYTLKDTPCGEVVGKGVCCFREGVRSLFPHDEALRDLNAESYVGTTLWDSKGRPNGLIAVIGRHPLSDPRRAESLLKMVAPRAAGELERRQVEAAIAESEGRLRRISAMISDVAYSCASDEDGRLSLRWMMGGVERITGYTIDELMERKCWGFLVIEEDRAFFAEKVSGLEPGTRGLCELRIRRRDGGIAWLESRAECVRSREHSDGTVLYGALVDITLRKQAEEEQARGRRLLQSVIDNAGYLIYAKEPDGRFVLASRSLADLFGRQSHEELLGKTSYDFLPEETADQHRANDLEVMEREALVRVEETVETPEGLRSYLSTKFPLVDAEGRMYAVGGASVDITSRKQAEEALRASEERYRTILRTALDGFWVLDSRGRLLEVNDACCAMVGYSRQELLGMSVFDLKDPSTHEETRLSMEHTAREGQGRFESCLRKKDGTIIAVEVSVQHRHVEGGRQMAFLRDVTEHKKAEEERARLEAQLQQSQKMEAVGRLAGGVAHDFNNMLQAILGNVDLAMSEIPPDSPARQELEEVRGCAERSADLTRQLLAFARKQTVAPKVLNLNETVTSMIKMLERLIGEGVRLDWKPASDLWTVRIDPSQIDQILANLCVNARDAIADVGEIMIETGNSVIDEEDCIVRGDCSPGEYVRLVVSDTGRGMDEATLHHIFEPFFTTKGIGEGTGLGLATVYGVVKQNHGFVDVASVPGSGTTFSIYLPKHLGKTAQPWGQSAAEPIGQGRETILLVEDEATILTLTTRMLTKQGYTVLAASSPGEAIRIAETYGGQIDLLVTDVIMPEMNGRDLAKNVLAHFPRVKRLFMSGYTADVIAHHGVLDPGIHFLQKPFSMRNLIAKVQAALEDQ